jgi:hypothetical protein
MELLEEMDISELDADMHLYVIRETESGRVKIGISRDPERRLRELQVGNSQKLEILATRKAYNGFADETLLHKTFSADQIRGEWFSSNARAALQ